MTASHNPGGKCSPIPLRVDRFSFLHSFIVIHALAPLIYNYSHYMVVCELCGKEIEMNPRSEEVIPLILCPKLFLLLCVHSLYDLLGVGWLDAGTTSLSVLPLSLVPLGGGQCYTRQPNSKWNSGEIKASLIKSRSLPFSPLHFTQNSDYFSVSTKHVFLSSVLDLTIV